MRGVVDPQPSLICLINPESRVPASHPIRAIKKELDEVLRRMSPLFDEMYAELGRPSIAPEQLLKAKVLIGLYSVRSERLFCEMLEYNLLFRWFLDMDMTTPAWNATTFSKNQERFLAHEAAKVFFVAVVERAREQGWVSHDHFTVDGTLIEAWASLKSFAPKKGEAKKTDDDPGNPSVDFKGQKRRNDTHESTTDPEAKLMRKAAGKEAKLSFGAHALMENRNGLCVDLQVRPSVGVSEPQAAQEMLDEQREMHGVKARSVGADKNYHCQEFVSYCRENEIKPHVAVREDRQTEGLDQRTTRSQSYETSQRIRKRVEEIFGWIKTVGGFRKTRHLGVRRTQLSAYIIGASYNLVRMARLAIISPG